MKTIIAAFPETAAAQDASNFLRGHQATDIDVVAYEADTDMIRRLSDERVPKDRAQIYAEVVQRGATLLIANVEDDRAEELADELDRRGALDLDAAQNRWRESGWSGYQSDASYDESMLSSEREAFQRDSMLSGQSDTRFSEQESTLTGDSLPQDLEVVEEKVRIGTRPVSRGGIRVRTHISERPVHEQVQLREERIDVSRERVDQPVSVGAADAAFTEGEFEVTAQGEEVVVGKEARVVERVHVDKEAETRTETIEETERRRDVEVEPIEGERPRR
jgi:stress response protein YsnF